MKIVRRRSGSFSAWERILARGLSRLPRVKAWVKRIYQRTLYRLHRKPYLHKAVGPIRSFGRRDSSSFYGYFDRSPENRAGLVLACVTSASTKRFSCSSAIDIGAFDEERNCRAATSTTAYNWQQGARALWLDEDRFIFNDIDQSNRIISKVFSVREERVVNEYAFPVQDVHRDVYFLSLNYARISALQPEYGYQAGDSCDAESLKKLDDDGVWRVDMHSGSSELLCSLESVLRLPAQRDFAGGHHMLNHAMISPNGERFIVVHRWYVDGRRYDRLLIGRSSSNDVEVLVDNGMVSHCAWISDNQILGYIRGPNGREGYWFVDVESRAATPVAGGKLDIFGDGHPHLHGDWFVTDTYPDKAAMQSLLLCNWRTGETQLLGEFFHGLDYWAEARCDLHPRFSPDGRRVYFDSVFSGQRQLYVMDLPER